MLTMQSCSKVDSPMSYSDEGGTTFDVDCTCPVRLQAPKMGEMRRERATRLFVFNCGLAESNSGIYFEDDLRLCSHFAAVHT